MIDVAVDRCKQVVEGFVLWQRVHHTLLSSNDNGAQIFFTPRRNAPSRSNYFFPRSELLAPSSATAIPSTPHPFHPLHPSCLPSSLVFPSPPPPPSVFAVRRVLFPRSRASRTLHPFPPVLMLQILPVFPRKVYETTALQPTSLSPILPPYSCHKIPGQPLLISCKVSGNSHFPSGQAVVALSHGYGQQPPCFLR